MKVLVFGGDGMLGHKVVQTLSPHMDVAYTTHYATDCPVFSKARAISYQNLNDLDTTVKKLLLMEKADVVVNCAGIVKQRQDYSNVEQCIRINALLPHVIANTQKLIGGRLITFSSDCVFLGDKDHIYTEESTPDSPSLYGRTKALGEITDNKNVLTVRTSMIGREIKGFYSLLEWFLAQKNKRITGYTSAMFSGTTTNYLARLIKFYIEKFPISGLCHIVSETISKFDLLTALNGAYGVNAEIVPDSVFELDKICNRTMDSNYIPLNDIKITWDELIDELSQDTTPYDSWR